MQIARGWVLLALACAFAACSSSSASGGGGASDADGGAGAGGGGAGGQGGSGGAGGGSCAPLGGDCSASAACCAGATCLNQWCCSRAGGACKDSSDCCFGTPCTGGTCECGKLTPAADGCLSDGDCCAETPDHQACVDGGSAPYGSCGFVGSLTIDSVVCQKVGEMGINIHKYCVSIGGTMEGPVGATWDLRTDPANTINEDCGPPTACDAWTDGLCTRGAGEPATTRFNWSYELGSDQANLDVMPGIELVSPNGGLDLKQVTAHCAAQ